MSRITRNGALVRDRIAPPKHARQRAARLMAMPPSRRCRLCLEQLENCVTPPEPAVEAHSDAPDRFRARPLAGQLRPSHRRGAGSGERLGAARNAGGLFTRPLAPAAYDLDMTQLEDEQLVELAQQCGYLPARDELICRFLGLAAYLVGRYASWNGLQEADSQDARQDAVLWILEAIRRYRTDESVKPDGCHFRSFLHRVITSRLVDFHRHLRLRNHSSLAGGAVSRPGRDSDRRRDEEDTALDVPDLDPNPLKCV